MAGSLKQQLAGLLNHAGMRRYGGNLFWLLLEKAVRVLVGFTVGVYVARQLGPAGYGLLNYAISLTFIFSFVIGMGIDTIVVRELVKTPERQAELLGSALLLKTIGLGLMLALLGGFLWFSNGAYETKLLIFIIGIGYAAGLFQVLDLYFQSRVAGKYVAISQVAALLVVAVFRVWGAYRGYSIIYFGVMESLYILLSGLGYLFFYWKLRNPLRWHCRADTVRMLFLVSLPIYLTTLNNVVYTRFDQILVRDMLGDYANGQYAVVVRVTDLFFLFVLMLGITVFPSLVGTRRTSLRRYYNRVSFLLGSMFYIALAGAVPTVIAGSLMIRLFYGAQYEIASEIFCIYVLKLVILYPSIIINNWRIAENMQKLSFYLSFFESAGSILCSYFLIANYGLKGAAAAAVINAVLLVVVFPCLFRKTRYGVMLIFRSIVLPWRIGWKNYISLYR